MFTFSYNISKILFFELYAVLIDVNIDYQSYCSQENIVNKTPHKQVNFNRIYKLCL